MKKEIKESVEKLFYSKDGMFQLDMQEYLRKHDIVFQSPQHGGFEGLPVGNGEMAAMVWTDERHVNMQINKSDLWTQPVQNDPMILRSAAKVSFDFCCPAFEPIQLEKFNMKLIPASGTVMLNAVTPFSCVKMQLRVLREINCIYVKLLTRGCGKVRISLERYGSRGFPFWYHVIDSEAQNGIGNAKTEAEEGRISITETFFLQEDPNVCTSVLVNGKKNQTTVVHNRRAEMEISESETETEYFIFCESGKEEVDKFCREKEDYCKKHLSELLEQTDHYWKEFWNCTRIFMKQDDAEWDYIENLYVIQRYMMACGCGKQYPMTFNGGTFTWNEDIRQWANPHHWNTHMVYNGTPGYLNRPELMEGYLNAYLRMIPSAKSFAKSQGSEDGILISEMHDFSGRMLAYLKALTPASQIALIFWDHYLFENDENFLRDKAYPFMKGAAEFYLQYAKEIDGIYHIFPAGVYECEFGEDFVDTTPDLCAVKALFPACIKAAKILGVDIEKRKEWSSFLEHLPEFTYMQNNRGEEILAVGKDKDGNAADFEDQNMTFMRNCANVYPWNITGISNRGERLYNAALHAVSDYRTTAVAISPTSVVYARLGIGGEKIKKSLIQAIRQLQHFPQGLYYNLDHWCQYSKYFKEADSFIKPQRDYIYDEQCRYTDIETGKGKTNLPMRPFVQCGFETPAILMMSIHESALQSHEDVIRIFPVRDLFGDCGFTLKARGGFLVSAIQRDGKIVPAVLIKSLNGKRCRISVSELGENIVLYAEGKCTAIDGDIAEFLTQPGEDYLLFDSSIKLEENDNFIRCTGENKEYKTLYEARIGSEHQF